MPRPRRCSTPLHLFLGGLLALFATLSTTADALDAATERRVRAATFEVVLPKPQVDSLTYERPLPLELVPFSIRNDKYQPIGTAFALDKSRFVTAAHVLDLAISSPHGRPLIRGQDGQVHAIGSILQLSLAEDYAIFTTVDSLVGKPLTTHLDPSIGEAVYAVGNALGEGIVVRSGLLTSQTPEDRDGAWHWLRFSAAASPGNSGGPLLDDAGRLIGVVLSKSPNENLNYALPIRRVLQPAQPSVASLSLRQSFGIPISPRSIVASLDQTLPLPMDYDTYAAAYLEAMNAFHDDSLQRFVAAERSRLFPTSPGAQRLLTRADWAWTLQLVGEEDNGEWAAIKAAGQSTLALPPDGELRTGTSRGISVMRLVKPSAIPLGTLFSDSKAFMDLILTGFRLSRPVADQMVRIVSLGQATTDRWHVDHYGRRWQLRTWPLEFSGSVLIVLALPKPDGADMMFAFAPAGLEYMSTRSLTFLADYAHAGYFGSLSDWQAFLALPSLHPRLFRELTLDIDPGKRIHLATRRFDLDLDNWVLDIGAQSRLNIQPGFFLDSDTVVWDVATVLVAEDRTEDTYITITRRARPAPAASPQERLRWADMVAGRGDYSGRPALDPPAVRVSQSVLPSPSSERPTSSDPPFLYLATFRVGQIGPPTEIMDNLDRIVRSLQVLE